MNPIQLGNNTPEVPFVFGNEAVIDRALFCFVCHEPFVDPKMHINCGNVFCSRCISSKEKCPLCHDKIVIEKLVTVPKIGNISNSIF